MREILKDYVMWICAIPITIIVVGIVAVAINGGK
jgi:hypothetical protein